ncbi:MAG: hypothetical protein II625_08000 [Bacilli bacterium]|jgi:hypothetical protein|nr:hypothetical protein [Bacilli bacterium]
MIKYKGYTLQITDEGCIIRNKNGKYLLICDTERNAKEYINEILLGE